MTDEEWRRKVRELLQAMANADYVRLQKVNRYNADSYWQRVEAATARVKAIHEELGL